jgi:phospholipid/cholesterol/gamma-HCH transport system substrate-binding protein
MHVRKGRLRIHALTAAALLLAAAAMVVTYLGMGGFLTVGHTYRLRAVLPTSANLTKGARVTMAGASVGRVTGVGRQGYATVVDMKLTDDDVAPVPADTRVTLHQRTPVGENFVSLAPGSSHRMLPSGSVLPIRQASDYVDLDQILSILRGRTKTEVRHLLQATGGALRGHGADLNVVLGQASEVVRSSADIFETLHDSRRQTAQLVTGLGRLGAAIGERGAAIEEIGRRGLTAMRALASRDAALRRTLDVLPSTLAQVRGTSGRLARTSRVAAPVVGETATTLRALAPAIADLGPAARSGRAAVAELGRTNAPLQRVLRSATGVSRTLPSALPPLHRTLCQVNPMVRYIAPYARDLVSPLMGLGSASNSYDAIGHLIRLQAIVGENSLVGLPKPVSDAAYTLLDSGLLVKTSGLSWNPYPKPGRIGSDAANPHGGNIANPAALKASGYKYPHIEADC